MIAGIAPLARRLGENGHSGAPGSALGGKGANLEVMVAAGLPVPSAGVVTTAAYGEMLAASPGVRHVIDRIASGELIPASAVDAAFALEVRVPKRLADAIVRLAADVSGGGRLAVRSSATVEDLEGSSFAGQYRSLLDVPGDDAEAVLEAVRDVWSSLWHPAPSAYRKAFDVAESDAAMAVVFMRMVDSERAGVVFTLDPGGEPDSLRVEAVRGYGEKLVSGDETPEAWVLSRNAQRWHGVPHGIAEATRLALEVEALFDVPQDVEWAADAESVFLLQARPITVLDEDDGFDTEIDDHELTTAGIVEMVPGVLPPLRWELNRVLLEESFRCVLDDLGVLAASTTHDRPFVRRVRGRAAIDFDQLRAVARSIPGAVEELELQYFGDRPTVPRETDRNLWQTVRHDLRVLRTRRRVIEQAEVVMRGTELLATRLPRITNWPDDELLRYRLRLTDFAARGLAGELGVAAAAAGAYRRLELQLERHLGPRAAARNAQLVVGGATADVTRRVSASAAVFAGPTWAELDREPPTLSHDGGSAEQARKELEARLRSLPGWRRRRMLTGQVVDVRLHMLRRMIEEARSQLLRREAAKAAVLELGGEVRRVHRELGRRLVERGVLRDWAEIELLTVDELGAALDGQRRPSRDVLQRRRNWLTRYEAEGHLPARFVGVPDRAPVPLPPGNRLTGWAAGPGRYRGRATACVNPDDTIDTGAVLVAEATDASWSPLFMRAGAIVVERGGPLSHAAILARELGLPAVLNVAGAVRALDGRTVTVDGDAGVVVVAEEEVQ